MTFEKLLAAIEDYKLVGPSNLETLSTLLNDAFGDWLASQGISHLMMLGDNTLCLNVRGELKHANLAKGIEFYSRFLVISLDAAKKTQRQ